MFDSMSAGHIATLIGMPRHSRHVGQGRLAPIAIVLQLYSLSGL